MREVYVAGTGMTRFGKFPTGSVKSMAQDAVADALTDAGVSAGQIDAVYFGNAISGLVTGQEMIRGQAALRDTGLLGVPLFNVENACASSSSALNLGVTAVASGMADRVVIVGAEKMTHPEDRARAKEALTSAVDLDELAMLEERAGGSDSSRSFFMDLYAETARAYMRMSGATQEDLADIVVKNRFHGSLNPHAQFQTPVTREEVLASRSVVDPLTLFMCSSIGDGAAALVLCSGDGLEVGQPRVRVAATALTSGYGRAFTSEEDNAARRAAEKAYQQAGVGPDELHVVELHDAAAPAELVVAEELLLCGRGEAPELLRSGRTRLGGSLPINPSGGLLAKGHPVGATGCAQIVELADQLRGRAGRRQVEGARVALAENGGGYVGSDSAAVAVTVLIKD